MSSSDRVTPSGSPRAPVALRPDLAPGRARSPRVASRRAIAALALVLTSPGCNTLSVFSSPEGNLSIGPRRANAGGASGPGGRLRDEGPTAPAPHVARSAFDRWRPPDVSMTPETGLRDRPATPLRVTAGPLEFTLRLSDTRAPSWGGDTYIRVDLRARGSETRPARDLAVLVDTRDASTLPRAKRMTAELFETLREGDRGALFTSDEGGRVRVPLLSYGAAPLLISRARTIEPRGQDDLAQAIERALERLAHRSDRIVKLAVLSGHGGLVSGETLEALSHAPSVGVEVVLVPLTEAAAHRFAAAAARSEAIAMDRVAATDRAERAAVDELATLPPTDPIARDVSLLYEALPAPSHLLDVYGGASAWTPDGGEIPLGDVRPGDARTIVLRAGIPGHPTVETFDPCLRVRWRDAQGPHEVRATRSLAYVDSPAALAAGRAGDVLHYVSLLGSISAVHRAIAAGDAASLESMSALANDQSRTLAAFAEERQDRVMSAQARILAELVATARAGW